MNVFPNGIKPDNPGALVEKAIISPGFTASSENPWFDLRVKSDASVDL